MRNVLLIGTEGVYNYGCEAIVRGTVNILKTIDPTITVTYVSYNYEDDKKRLKDCDVNIMMRPKRERKRWSRHNILRKLFSYIKVRYIMPYDSLDLIKNCDTVFSIGGDIYTLNPDNTCNLELPKFLRRCQKKGLRYILWGASVGKFEKNQSALNFYKKHLPKIDLIVAREPNTVEYLRSLGVVDNVHLAPDPAFFVECPQQIKETKERITIGINLSPLSALYKYESIERAIVVQTGALISLIELMDCDVILLPHVISPNPNDNDLLYLRKIYESVPSEYQAKITLVDTDPQFIGIKSYLSRCDYVVAARMHCAINAITLSVPTLFLSYSEKAKGMAEFIYNSKDFVISLEDFENPQLIACKLQNLDSVSQLKRIKGFDYKVIFNK